MQLPQSLTLASAGAALAHLQQSAATGGVGKTLAIDASTLQTFDTAALAVLLQARRMAQAAGQVLQVSGAPPQLAQLAKLYGVAELLGLDS